MIPGFSNALMPPGHEKESGAKIKRYMCIMDSMTNKELDSSDPKLFTVCSHLTGMFIHRMLDLMANIELLHPSSSPQA